MSFVPPGRRCRQPTSSRQSAPSSNRWTRIDPAMAEVAGLGRGSNCSPDCAGRNPAAGAARRCPPRLLWLHVATWTIADESGAASVLPVDLVQIFAADAERLRAAVHHRDEKVGGMSLNRFGGFLKRSWRMNDWTWGRMDAATMLCQVILSPERLRRRAIQEATSPPNHEDRAEVRRALTAKPVRDRAAGPGGDRGRGDEGARARYWQDEAAICRRACRSSPRSPPGRCTCGRWSRSCRRSRPR